MRIKMSYPQTGTDRAYDLGMFLKLKLFLSKALQATPQVKVISKDANNSVTIEIPDEDYVVSPEFHRFSLLAVGFEDDEIEASGATRRLPQYHWIWMIDKEKKG